jgi:DNA-binding transcriptional LysR family regulator
VVVGAPSYFAGRQRPIVPADLLLHQCIRARMGTGKLYRWEFEKHGQVVLIDAPGALTLDESGLMVEAALAGAGVAYIGEASGAEDIAAGRLEVILADWTPPYPGLSLSRLVALFRRTAPYSRPAARPDRPHPRTGSRRVVQKVRL